MLEVDCFPKIIICEFIYAYHQANSTLSSAVDSEREPSTSSTTKPMFVPKQHIAGVKDREIKNFFHFELEQPNSPSKLEQNITNY